MTDDRIDAALARDLIAAQQELGNVARDSSAPTQDGRSYRYVSLDAVMASVRPVLAAHRLTITHATEAHPAERTVTIWTTLLHESGATLSTSIELPVDQTGTAGIHAIGSAVTYGRRYGVLALLGIAADADDDGQAAAQLMSRSGESSPFDGEQVDDRPPHPDGLELVKHETFSEFVSKSGDLSAEQRDQMAAWKQQEIAGTLAWGTATEADVRAALAEIDRITSVQVKDLDDEDPADLPAGKRRAEEARAAREDQAKELRRRVEDEFLLRSQDGAEPERPADEPETDDPDQQELPTEEA